MSDLTVQMPSKLSFLAQPYRYKVAYGGRGGAKSRSFAAQLVVDSMTRKERILCCREIQNSIEESVKKTIENEIDRLQLGNIFDVTGKTIRCIPTGADFIFKGLRGNIASIKSIEGVTKCWVEEAHTVSQYSLDVLDPTIREAGSELWFSYNPEDEEDPIHQMFVVNEPPPGSMVVEVNYWDNPWFPDVLRTKMLWDKERDDDKYQHIWCGQCRKTSDEQIMKGCWRIGDTPEPTADTVVRHGFDFGFGSDPIAGVRCWIDGTTLYIDHEVYGHGVEIDQIGEALVKSIPGVKNWPITADSARPDTISYLNRNGFTVVPSKKGAGSVEDGIAFIKSFEVVINPRCKETIREFKKYSYKKDTQTDKILPIIVDDWNHCIDSLRYALEGELRMDLFINHSSVMAAVKRELEEDEYMFSPLILGVYTKRFANDETVVTLRHGAKLIWQKCYASISPFELATKIAHLMGKYGIKSVFVSLGGDDPSGASVINALCHKGFDSITAVDLGGSAGDDLAYSDKPSEIWGKMREWLETGDIPSESRLINDISTPVRFYDNKHRIKIEKQEDTLKRVTRNPARGYSLAMTFSMPVAEQVHHADLEPEAVPAY